jgi:AraC family transcriptional regulator
MSLQSYAEPRFLQLPERLVNVGWRPSTYSSHHGTVVRVIQAMRDRLSEPFSLQAFADIAILSPYHFDRVFRAITGISPSKFHAALRMTAAKQLLLTTRLSVTDVCFELGYGSLGTFTTHFTEYIGVSPRRFRQLPENSRMNAQDWAYNRYSNQHQALLEPHSTGRLSIPHSFEGLIYIGLFPSPIPQGRPVACTLLTSPGTYTVSTIPDGKYYVFAAAFSLSDDPLAYLLPDNTQLWVGTSEHPLWVRGGQAIKQVDVTLRPMQITDPPILVALPVLLAAQQAVVR